MVIVNFLAQFWGFSLIIISLSLLIRPKNIEYALGLMEDNKNLLMFGVTNVMLGVVLVLLHNSWNQDWKVIVTILGWLVLVRGIICLFSPDTGKKVMRMVDSNKDKISYFLVGLVLLGCVLVYLGQTV